MNKKAKETLTSVAALPGRPPFDSGTADHLPESKGWTDEGTFDFYPFYTRFLPS